MIRNVRHREKVAAAKIEGTYHRRPYRNVLGIPKQKAAGAIGRGTSAIQICGIWFLIKKNEFSSTLSPVLPETRKEKQVTLQRVMAVQRLHGLMRNAQINIREERKTDTVFDVKAIKRGRLGRIWVRGRGRRGRAERLASR